MLVYGRSGPQTIQDGSPNELRLSKDSGIVIQDGHARYQEAVYRGNVFHAANQATTAITNLATTATGLILSNPAASGKNLVLLRLALVQSSVAAAAASQIVLAANVNPIAAATVHTTPLTVRNCLLGSGNAAVGLADGAATLPAAPVVVRAIWAPSVSATATTGVPPLVIDEIAGELVLTPGTTVSLSSTAAFSAIASLSWEEIPI